MSRRHTDITSVEPLPEDCRFYAPLNYGDVTDHVSGVSPTVGTATISYDTTMGAYKVSTTTGGQLAWIYNIPNVNVYTQPYTYTMLAKVYVVSFTGTCDVVTVGKTGNESTSSMQRM